MGDRSYSAIASGPDRVIAIDAKTGIEVRSWKVPYGSSIISVTPSGDTATVVMEDSSGKRKGIVMKLPALSQIRSFPVASSSRSGSTSSGSASKADSSGSSSRGLSSYAPERESSGPPSILDDDEESLKSLFTLRGFFSLFTILGRIGNTLKRFSGKPVNGQCLTKRDLKALPLLLIIGFLWATCSGNNPHPRQQQVRQFQQQPRLVAQRQTQSSQVRVPRADTVVDTQNIAERMKSRYSQPTSGDLSDNPNDNTPPNFPNDLPSGFKRVFIQSPVGYLNMRAGPDTNSVIICQIPNNEVIYVENEDKLWLSAVRPKDNSQGYVNSGRLGEFAFPFGRNR
jgi:hypothetical protein